MSKTLGRSLLCLVAWTALSLDGRTMAEQQAVGQEAFADAALLYRQGEWQRAAAIFQRCTKEDANPNTQTKAHFYWGECLMQLGDYAQARDHYLTVLEREQEGVFARRALFRSGEAAWLEGDAKRAEAVLRQFVHQYPHDASAAYAYSYLGDIALSTHDWQRAIGAYRTVVDSYAPSPRVKQARLGLAKALLAVGREQEVPVALGDLPTDADRSLADESLLLTGRGQYQAGQYEAALAAFRKLYRRFADEQTIARAHLAAAWSLWKLGRFDHIDDELAPLAKDARWAVERHYLLGMAAYGARQWPPAIEELTLAAAAAPDYPGRAAILLYAGESCFRDGQYDAAQHWYRQLNTNYPTSQWADDALWGLARVARATNAQDQFTAAVAELRRRFPASAYLERLQQTSLGDGNAKQGPTSEEPIDQALGFERDGRYDAALAAYRQIIDNQSLGPARAEAIRRAARLHNRLAQYREARRRYEQLLAEDPNSPYAAEAVYALAWIYLRTGDTPAAAAQFREVHKKFPQSAQAPEAAYWLALVAADEKDSALALQYVDGLLDELSTAASSPSSRQRNLWGQALCLKCQLEASAGNWQQVKDALANADDRLDEGPLGMRAKFWLAEAAFRTQQYDQASVALNDLQLRTADLAEPWVAMVPLRRAQLAARRQQWTEVLKIVDRLERDYLEFPLQYEVDYLRGRAQAGRGEMTAARRAYRRVLENKAAANTETAAMAQWMIGETFFHQRDYTRAREAYLRVMDRYEQPDWQARAALQAGKCWELEGHWEEAQTLYSAALEQWQGSEPEERLQARLKWANRQVVQRR